MTKAEFEKLVYEGFESIPEKFRRKIANVAILVEDEPSDEIRRQEGLTEEETLLGYYQGVPNTVRGDNYGVGPTLPDTITIFRKPTEEEAGGDPDLIRRVARDTIWHECAHYFGMDENEVRRWEEKKKDDI